ncbi:Fic family protein, partial [Rhodovulum sulfidophilum]|nr:Fic family protein [Rhodovulum sulfidophilum]
MEIQLATPRALDVEPHLHLFGTKAIQTVTAQVLDEFGLVRLAGLAAFMDHFDKRFQIGARSSSGRIIVIASAHHRLNYIHPFPDGNGRVSRLMSHAMALTAGIGGQGLWSVSRGLARGMTDRGEYKRM